MGLIEFEYFLRKCFIEERLISYATGVVKKYGVPLHGVESAYENDALKRVLKVLAETEGDTSTIVALVIGEVAQNNPKKLEVVCNALTKYEAFIKKYKKSAAIIAQCIAQVAKRKPDELEAVIKVIETGEGYTQSSIAGFIGHIAETNAEELGTVIDLIGKLKMPSDYIEVQKKILNLPEVFFTFKKNYFLGSKGGVIEADEVANEHLYAEGVKIINGIKRGKIKLNPDLSFFYPNEMKRLQREATSLTQRLSEAKGKDRELLEVRRLIHMEKRKLEEKIISEKLKELREKGKFSLVELKEELSQLSQHWVGKDIGREMENIADSIVIAEGQLTSKKIEVEVWKKSFKDPPTYKEYKCCVFPGFRGGERHFLSNILTPAIQLLKLRIGNKTAIAICAATSFDGKKVLLIDGFESGSHIFERKEVAEAALHALKEWAAVSGFRALLVSAYAASTAPREFYRNVEGKEVSGLKLEIIGPFIAEVNLEGLWGGARGKIYKLE